MWFRSANSHTGPQPLVLHQRPDRWQHPTTCPIPEFTACVFWGVHRWKADIQRLGILRMVSDFRLFDHINNSAFSIRPTRAALNGHGEQTFDFNQVCNLGADVL